ncbi:MAG: tetratricopeptide repeat protein [Flavobacteriales bacterium]|nr:tetratricopeptide repeat protein [Flavobacteriales bacterium]MBK6945001.1 tetratricopeptide repeat protein [Flavobacteriales bacterium]MBK7239348.1 tetratricopeptide repeat protein [Flavobacteriales bacterium]MBK9535447.1 tetratricopeptide repeat protein [Flavobacteriales bacterium]MBP9137653.1 tetratricopeptide repeat protein [Flavobacteriales bacterium]
MFRSLLFAILVLPVALSAQTSADELLAKATNAYAAETYDLAQAYADSAIALNGELPGAHKLRGDIKQRQKNLHGALLDYVIAEKLDDTDPRLFVSRSAIHITEGRLKDAIQDINRALKLDPDDGDAYYNEACANYLGLDNSAALRSLDRALDLKPASADALFLRGVVKGELYKEEDGFEDIEAALKIKPGIVGGDMSAAILLFEMERYDEAIERLTKVITTDSLNLAEAHYYRAECYYGLENKEKACADWRVCGEMGDSQAQYIVRNYCNSEETKIPKKPKRERKSVIEF